MFQLFKVKYDSFQLIFIQITKQLKILWYPMKTFTV